MWSSKVSAGVAFFVDCCFGKILMWKRCIIELDWCCMRKCSEEIVDHLLIRCPIAT